MTTLTYRLAGTLARAWGPGDEVVVSRLDHDANVRPWVQAAERAGATVRWAEVDVVHRGTAGRAVRRADLPNGPGWSRSPRPATCIGTRPDVPGDHRRGPGGRRAQLRGRRARHAAWPGRRGRARRRFLRHQRLQVVRPARRRGDRRPGAARHAAPGQAGPRAGQVPGPVRAGHPAVRRPGWGHRGGGPPGRARAAPRPGSCAGAGAGVDGRGGSVRAGAVRRACWTGWPG